MEQRAQLTMIMKMKYSSNVTLFQLFKLVFSLHLFFHSEPSSWENHLCYIVNMKEFHSSGKGGVWVGSGGDNF